MMAKFWRWVALRAELGRGALWPMVPVFLVTAAIAIIPLRALGTEGCNLQVWFNGRDATGTTQSGYVGQQIVLEGKPMGGLTATSQSWSVTGTTAGSADTGGKGFPSADFTQTKATFYWLTAGNALHVTFTAQLSNGMTESADVYFNISGPTSVTLSPNPPSMGKWQFTSGPDLQLGCQLAGCIYGITLTGQASPPLGAAGEFEWVQVMDTFTGTETTQPAPGYPNGYTYDCSAPGGLDGGFPRATGLTTNDSPYISFNTANSQESVSFTAVAFLMWDPTTSSSDIAVPIGNVTWGGSAGAKDTAGSLSLVSSSTSPGSFSPSATDPEWGGPFAEGGYTCQ